MADGNCKLCLLDKPLVDSHLMPRALYDLCRPPDGSPIIMSNDVVMASDRQLKYPLLCAGCEDLLNKNGENWLLPQLARIDGAFRLYDVLQEIPAEITDGDTRVYAAGRNPKIEVSTIIHFAMGIFWKAAAHSWKKDTKEPWTDLGSYRDAAREYLLGISPFSTNMVLTVGINPPPVKMIGFNYPYRDSETGHHRFRFYVPGILFVLQVGKNIPTELKSSCFVANPVHPVLVLDLYESLRDVARHETRRARVAKNVRKYLKPRT